jgi:hypothetical protein
MNFDIAHLRRPDRIIGAGGVLLFVFLFFFKWFAVSTNASSIGGVNLNANFSYNGWHTFSDSRWIWLITILVALAAVAVRVGKVELPSRVRPGVVVAGLGTLSTALIVFRILHHPTFSSSFAGVHTSVGIKVGIWLGLIAAVAIAYGGSLAMQEEAVSVADVSGATPA